MRSSLSLLLFVAILFPTSVLRLVNGQKSTASWQFPLNEGFTINVIDTVVLQWTSNYEEAWLMMWCQIDGPGPDVSLGECRPRHSYQGFH
jgi:hypothetical protein